MAEYRSDRSTVERLEINTCSLGTMRAHHKFGQCCSILLGVGRLRNENIWPMDMMRPGHETRETTVFEADHFTWSWHSIESLAKVLRLSPKSWQEEKCAKASPGLPL